SIEQRRQVRRQLQHAERRAARTIHVPKGRPPFGNPPFTFEESGVDALTFEKMDQVEDWTLAGSLFRLEAFNGFGSRAHGINTPYLWSFSNHYEQGKIVADGLFRSHAR